MVKFLDLGAPSSRSWLLLVSEAVWSFTSW